MSSQLDFFAGEETGSVCAPPAPPRPRRQPRKHPVAAPALEPCKLTIHKRPKRTNGSVAAVIGELLSIAKRNAIGSEVIADKIELASLEQHCTPLDVEHLSEFCADLARAWRHRKQAEQEGKPGFRTGWRGRLGGERRASSMITNSWLTVCHCGSGRRRAKWKLYCRDCERTEVTRRASRALDLDQDPRRRALIEAANEKDRKKLGLPAVPPVARGALTGHHPE